jgi:phage/plasmid-associated DNA primase
VTVHFVIFSANKIPYSDDTGHAYYKRWLILHFERSFREGAKNINLIHKLTTDNELSGLLNLALVGLKQLEKDWSFRDISVEDVKRDYERKSNIVKAFLQDKCSINKVQTTVLHQERDMKIIRITANKEKKGLSM